MTSGPPLHHVGIVMPDEDDVRALMTLMGLEEDFRGYVPEWAALCIFTKRSHGSPIEFVVPGEGSALARFNKGAGGLHHVALQVSDLDAVQARLAGEGMALLEKQHVKGAGNFLCNFLSPIYTRGITIEFVQPLDASAGV
jgi:methylmalonyl-CoA/ethylmalonyl-CoA epimerase